MPKKKGVGKSKVQETPEERQMRLEMEELKVCKLYKSCVIFDYQKSISMFAAIGRCQKA